jgi:hypothetical protein
MLQTVQSEYYASVTNYITAAEPNVIQYREYVWPYQGDKWLWLKFLCDYYLYLVLCIVSHKRWIRTRKLPYLDTA